MGCGLVAVACGQSSGVAGSGGGESSAASAGANAGGATAIAGAGSMPHDGNANATQPGAGEATGQAMSLASAGHGGDASNAAGGQDAHASGGAGAGAAAGGASGDATGAGGMTSGGNGAAAGGPSVAGGSGGALSGGTCPLWPSTAVAAPSEFRLGDTTVRLSDHDCSWIEAPAVALPAPAGYTRLVFQYDVNGDGVDDLFIGPNPRLLQNPQTMTPDTLTLLVSKLDGGVLSFEATGCTVPALLVDGEYVLRDLDADGVPDFVIGVANGLRVVMNRPSGPEQTVAYDFPASQNAEWYLGDVTLGQFEKDDTSELAIGFLRQADNYQTMQMGTLLFPAPTEAKGISPVALVTSNQTGNGLDLSMNPELGLFTALQQGRALYGVSENDDWLYSASKLTRTKNGNTVGEPTYVASLTVGGNELVLEGLGSGAPPLDKTSAYLFDPKDYAHGTQIPCLYSHGLAYGRSRSYLLTDVDGDGDAELIETDLESTSGGATGVLAIHNGDAATGPESDTHLVEPNDYSMPYTETPFLAVGAAKGRLLVSDGDETHPDLYPLRVSPVVCRE
jgi:hypothetical protein